MRVLLSDGSGLTARQVATILAAKGHEVHALAPDPFCLTRFTRHVRRVHRVPAFGLDPFSWLDATRAVVQTEAVDVLLPTQEHVTLLAREADTLDAATVVPSFEAILRVQDKAAAAHTLDDLGLPQPPWRLARDRADLLAVDFLPGFVKPAIGTAGSGVQHVVDREGLHAAATQLERAGAFEEGPVVVQRAVDGPLAMLQSVFDHGSLIAFHANLRVRAGSNNGAAIKRSIRLPAARESMARLGHGLGWHGALSADAILTTEGPLLIDINPRLVEPTNALYSGVDLVEACLALALGATVEPVADGIPDVTTHQTLLALLGAAERAGRRGAFRELGQAMSGRGPYRNSREELTPLHHDLRTVLPVAMVAIAVAVRPAWWTWFASGAVENYALTSSAWTAIRGQSA